MRAKYGGLILHNKEQSGGTTAMVCKNLLKIQIRNTYVNPIGRKVTCHDRL